MIITVILCVAPVCSCVEHEKSKKIAIIGAGIAGGSAAYFTQKFLEEAKFERADIEVFERENYVGGRLKHINFKGVILELGGAAWAKNNHYMMEMASVMGMNITGSQTDSEHVRDSAVWTGRGFAPIYKIMRDDSPSMQTVAREEASFMHNINSKYEHQLRETYYTLNEFLEWGEMSKYSNASISAYFKALGVPSDFIETELVPMTRAIYNQGSDANVFFCSHPWMRS